MQRGLVWKLSEQHMAGLRIGFDNPYTAVFLNTKVNPQFTNRMPFVDGSSHMMGDRCYFSQRVIYLLSILKEPQ